VIAKKLEDQPKNSSVKIELGGSLSLSNEDGVQEDDTDELPSLENCKIIKNSKNYEGIPSEWHETLKIENSQTKRAKLFFRCKFEGCGSIFRKSCNLRDHFRKHTMLRPFQCDICNKNFTQSGNLGRHLKNVHLISRAVPKITKINAISK